jgi:hypothetical protein
MPDPIPHTRASDKAWDLAVKVAAGLTLAVCLWAANAERRLSQSESDADRAIVLVDAMDSSVRKLELEQTRAEEQRANMAQMLGEIRADVKELLDRRK